jgi:hypothetical protein
MALSTVRSQSDWARRVSHIKANMLNVMDPLPEGSVEPLDMKVVEEVRTEKYVRQRITYRSERSDRVTAYLLIPYEHRGYLPG